MLLNLQIKLWVQAFRTKCYSHMASLLCINFGLGILKLDNVVIFIGLT